MRVERNEGVEVRWKGRIDGTWRWGVCVQEKELCVEVERRKVKELKQGAVECEGDHAVSKCPMASRICGEFPARRKYEVRMLP